MTAAGRESLRRRILECARREPVTFALFVVASVAVILPVWIGRYLPLLDYPNHLSMVFVWRHLHDPQWNFAPFYDVHFPPLPYWAQYAMVYGFSLLVGVEAAQKVFLSLFLLLLPLSVALYARRVGRDPRLALLAFPLAWNFNVAYGFLAFVAGVPVLFLALAALDRYGERPTFRWAAIASLLGVSLYLFHVLPWALFLLAGGVTALLAPRPWSLGRALLAPLPTLPALGLGLLAYRASRGAAVPVNPWTPQGLSAFQGVHQDLATNLGGFSAWLLDFFPGGSDEAAAAALGFVWLLVVASRPLAPAGAAPPRNELADRDPRSWRPEVGAAITLALFFLLPWSLLQPFYWYAVNCRLAVVVAALLLLAARGPIAGPRRALLVLGGVVGIAYLADVSAHFRRFNQRARGFDEVMAAVPAGRPVLPVLLKLGDPEVNVNCYNQWGSYVQMRQGGYNLFNFTVDFPVKTLRRLPTPPWNRPDLFNFAAHGGPWDYFLVHGPSPIDPFAGVHDRVKLLRRSGEWEVWEKLAPGAAAPKPNGGER